MKLFFICAVGDDGANLDLVVVAPTATEAENLWRTYHEREEAPCWVGEIPNVSPHPDQGAGVVEWSKIRPWLSAS